MVALLSLHDELADRLLRSRTISLTTEVDDDSAALVVAQLHLLDQEDADRPIRFFLNSPGGSVTAGLAIHDAMQFVSAPVATIATGLCASMGQILLVAGEPGRRFALPNTAIMMHQGSAGVGGVAADVLIQADQLARTRDRMNEILARHTGQTPERIQADSDRDHWFTPEEARDYGMIDHLVATERELADHLGVAR